MLIVIPAAATQFPGIPIVAALGIALFLVVSAFLFHKAAQEVQHKSGRKGLKAGSLTSLILAGLAIGVVLLEIAIRLINPGGFLAPPPDKTPWPEAEVEELNDGTAFWWYQNKRGFDSEGYRGHKATRAPSLPGIVFLGDSVAFGVETALEKTFPQLLVSSLDQRCGPVQSWNLAVPGYSTIQERIAFERRGAILDPDIVVLSVVPNDMVEFVVLDGHAYDASQVHFDQERPTFKFLPLPDEINSFLFRNLALYQFVTLTGVAGRKPSANKQRTEMDELVDEIRIIHKLAREDEATLAIVLFTTMLDEIDTPADENERRLYSKIEEWGEKHPDVFVWRIRPWLAQFEPDEIRFDPWHFTVKGHEKVAEFLLPKLRSLPPLDNYCEGKQ